MLAALTGVRRPRFRVPYGVAWLAALCMEGAARVSGGTPQVPLNAVRMGRKRMYFSAAKAVRELGLPQTPAEEALRDAVTWFVDRGYAPRPRRSPDGAEPDAVRLDAHAQEPLELLLRLPLPAPASARGHLRRVRASVASWTTRWTIGARPRAQREELERWRAEIVQVFEGRPEHPAAQRLQEAVRLFTIPREALNEIIAGVEMDLDRSHLRDLRGALPLLLPRGLRGRTLLHRDLRVLGPAGPRVRGRTSGWPSS